MQDNNIKDELENRSPLFGREKKNPFKVPENYFEKLPLRIQDKTSGSAKRWDSIWMRFLHPRMVAASLIIVILIISGIFYFKRPLSPAGQMVINKMDTVSNDQRKINEITSQIRKEDVKQAHIENIEEEVIVDEIQEDVLPAREVIVVDEEAPGAALIKEEIDYLIDNADLSLIMDELNEN